MLKNLLFLTLLTFIPVSFADNSVVTKASHGMVSSQTAIASQIGIDILKKGGNAVDSAVAVGYALAVTLPEAGNIGGGGFMLIHLAKEQKTIALNYREMAPHKAHRDMFLDDEKNVKHDALYRSALSSGIPGTVMGLNAALKQYGSLPLKTVIQPAIDLAEKGFVVYPELAGRIARFKDKLSRDEDAAKIFYHKDGKPYLAGETLVQKDLAWSLKQIRDGGTDVFYKGELAKRISEDSLAKGGVMSLKDLQHYKVEWLQPVSGSFHGYTIYSMPPPSSGGIALIQLLNILEGYPLDTWKFQSAKTVHTMVEAMNFTFADRTRYLGDPNFVEVPTEKLISKSYAKTIREKIKPNRHLLPEEVASKKSFIKEPRNTTHYSVVDNEGNIVSNTYTLNSVFGNGIVAKGTGILMNNEMDDFSAKPLEPNQFGVMGSEANAIAALKRPLSSMTPTIVMKDNQYILATGSPGGSRIITTVLQTLLNTLVFKMDIAKAGNATRFHSQWYPDAIIIEKDFPLDTQKQLEKMGHKFKHQSWTMGSVQSVLKKDDALYGASDIRRAGKAVGY